jgi:hypothetical protein
MEFKQISPEEFEKVKKNVMDEYKDSSIADIKEQLAICYGAFYTHKQIVQQSVIAMGKYDAQLCGLQDLIDARNKEAKTTEEKTK